VGDLEYGTPAVYREQEAHRVRRGGVMSAIRINPISVWQDPPFPFNQAVVEPAGRRVHLTGQVAWTPDGELIGAGDAEMQTEFAIENIRRILAELGGTLADVMSTTMY
jgi:enamine deaminase RidA (YjgF/YER057c/UK114 family)